MNLTKKWTELMRKLPGKNKPKMICEIFQFGGEMLDKLMPFAQNIEEWKRHLKENKLTEIIDKVITE